MQIIIILFLILTAPLSAQLKGVVVDLNNSKPIKGAIIDDDNREYITSTNTEGEFVIDSIQVGDRFHIHAEGYHMKIYTVENEDDLKYEKWFALIPLEFEFQKLEVFSELYKNPTDNLNSLNSLQESSIKDGLDVSLSETMKSIAGVYTRSMGNSVTAPVIRAYSGNRITVNDENINSLDLSGSSSDHTLTIDAASVRSIELQRGPKVLTTSNTVNGGVINIDREPKVTDKFSVSSLNSFNTVDNGYLLSVKTFTPYKKFGVSADASLRNGTDIYSPDGNISNTEYTSNTIRGALYYFGEKYKIDFSIKQFETDYGVPGGFVGAHPNGVDISMLRRTYDIDFEYYDVSKSINKTKLKVYRNYYGHEEYERNDLIGAEYAFESIGSVFDMFHNKFLIFDDGQFGLEYEYRDYKVGGFVFTPNTQSNRFSAYVYENVNYNEFNFEFSSRYSFIDYGIYDERRSFDTIRNRSFNLLSLSTSISKEINQNLSLGVMTSLSNRAPSFEELYSAGPHLAAYNFEIGNDDISQEIGLNSEIFLILNYKKLRSNFSVYVDLYDSYITYRNTADTNWATLLPIFSTFQAPAEIYGVDFNFDYDIFNKLNLSGNLVYAFGRFRDTGSPLPFIPPLSSYLKLNWHNQNWNAYADVELAAGQNRTDQFEQSTNGYYVLGGGLSYKNTFFNTVHAFRLDFDNITNNLYRNHLSIIRSIYPEPGFGVKFTWSIDV